VKFDLGKVSKNEILQIQLEILNAQKAVGAARRDMQIASLNLRSYTGLEGGVAIKLVPPKAVAPVEVSTDTIMKEALENRSDAIAFIRRVAEAQRDVAVARGQNGLTAVLTANLGYSKTSGNFGKVYQNPQDQQLLQLQFTVPILDWGRAKARTATAKANEQLVQYTVEQDKQTFRQQIVTQVSLFNLMKDQILITGEADSIAHEKYLISKQRYVMGDMSITDLSISFEENDRAKRDYITSLRDYWGAYYQLRYLSLYDFELREKITYK
jgi:outer membrane protein TolC